MITDILNLSILIFFSIFGFKNPHIAYSSAIWVDLYKPQLTSSSFLSGLPLSAIFTIYFFFSCIINIQKITVPKNKLYHIIIIFFSIWITITTFLAEFQLLAWLKYDISIKTILIAYFLPFVLNTKARVETFLWLLLASFGAFFFAAGLKSILGGGGYEVALIADSRFMWAEGSTLATQAISFVPILIYLYSKSELGKSNIFSKGILIGFILCSVAILIGTQSRSGLIAFIVLFLIYFINARSKLNVILLLILITPPLYFITPQSWFDRMSSMKSVQNIKTESSAMGRVNVWNWTLNYVNNENPMTGGGFNSYHANLEQLPSYNPINDEITLNKNAKAFHSIIFEVLGEHGWIGLIIFLFLIMKIFLTKSNDLWNQDLLRVIKYSTIVYCAGGMFLGIAFYPWIYYMYGLSAINVKE